MLLYYRIFYIVNCVFSGRGFTTVFTARRYAKRGLCRCRVSVCLSHSGIVSKCLNIDHVKNADR